MTLKQQIMDGFNYFIQGWNLIKLKELRHFVVLPILANIIIMSLATYVFFDFLSYWQGSALSFLPSWLQWLKVIFIFFIYILLIFIFCYFFSVICNLIASPFNSLLSERVEEYLNGDPLPEVSFFDLLKDTPRILSREICKLTYFLIRCLFLFLLHFVPFIGQIIVPLLWIVLGFWMIYLQYIDYPFDNRKFSFQRTLSEMHKNRVSGLVFGALINLFTIIPIVNLFIMPVAVCGATYMWHERMSASVCYQEKRKTNHKTPRIVE